MGDNLNGRYAFRFNGFDNAGGGSFFLLGIGVMELRDGELRGWHRSASMPISGGFTNLAQLGGRFVEPAAFSLNGQYKLDGHGVWMVKVRFDCVQPKQTMRCTFALVPAAPGTLWLASHTTEVAAPNGAFQKVAEMASGEAVKIGELPVVRPRKSATPVKPVQPPSAPAA